MKRNKSGKFNHTDTNIMSESTNTLKMAEWTDETCPKCRADLLSWSIYYYCSHVGCDYGIDTDKTIIDLIEDGKQHNE